MPYRIWGPAWADEELTDAWILDYSEIASDLLPRMFSKDAPEIKMDLTVATEDPPADYFSTGVPQFVSEPLKTTIEAFEVDAEFVPVTVLVGEDKVSEVPYFLMNVYESVDCLDEERGKYKYRKEPGKYNEIEEVIDLAIDESQAKGHHLFWIDRVSQLLCVSQELQSAIRAVRYTGIGFRDPDKHKVLNKHY